MKYRKFFQAVKRRRGFDIIYAIRKGIEWVKK